MTLLHRRESPVHSQDVEPPHEHATVRSTSMWEQFSVVQAICLAIGVFFLVIGAVGLARTGIDSMTTPTVLVAGLGMTPLLAFIHLGMGVVACVGAVSRFASRSVNLFLGALLLAGGIIALIQPMAIFGWSESNGFAYLIVGVVAILSTLASPVEAVSTRQVIVDRDY